MNKIITAFFIAATIIVLGAIFILSDANANAISDITRDKAAGDLRARLIEDYPEKYTTINMLLKSGMRAYGKLCNAPTGEPHDTIIRSRTEDYYPNFATIWLLYRSDIKAWEELNGE